MPLADCSYYIRIHTSYSSPVIRYCFFDGSHETCLVKNYINLCFSACLRLFQSPCTPRLCIFKTFGNGDWRKGEIEKWRLHENMSFQDQKQIKKIMRRALPLPVSHPWKKGIPFQYPTPLAKHVIWRSPR